MGNVLFMRKGEIHSKPIVGLPAGYTELEYIEGTGTQYIDSNFYPNQNTRIEIDFMCTGDMSVFGTQNGFGNRAFMHASTMACFGNSSTQAITAWSNNVRYTCSHSKEGTYRNGTLLWTPTYNEFTAAYTLTLMGNHEGNTVYPYDGRVYSCQIYDNGTLVRDFIPCINNSGEIGLYDRVNKTFYGNAGTGVFKCNLDFANVTWEEVITACQTNKVPAIWNVGDQKTMTIDGTNYVIDIIGKNHDEYSDGSGKAPITFQLHSVYGFEGYNMNNEDTNSGGWTECHMRTTILPAILTKMPIEVQSGIKQVNKKTSAGSKSSTINTTADKLFLLSEIETGGIATNSFEGEGSQYEYYAAGNSDIKYTADDNGAEDANNATDVWHRSPSRISLYSFCYIISDGTYSADGADTYYDIAFAFCF